MTANLTDRYVWAVLRALPSLEDALGVLERRRVQALLLVRGSLHA